MGLMKVLRCWLLILEVIAGDEEDEKGVRLGDGISSRLASWGNVDIEFILLNLLDFRLSLFTIIRLVRCINTFKGETSRSISLPLNANPSDKLKFFPSYLRLPDKQSTSSRIVSLTCTRNIKKKRPQKKA